MRLRVLWVPRLPPKLASVLECLLQPARNRPRLQQQAVARQSEQQWLHAQHESNIPTHDRDAYTRALPAALPSLCPALAAQLPCPCTCRAACCCLSALLPCCLCHAAPFSQSTFWTTHSTDSGRIVPRVTPYTLSAESRKCLRQPLTPCTCCS